MKNQNAYSRRLDYDAVPKERAAPAFNGMISSWNLRGPEDVKTAQDFLFRYCVGKATEYGLPVKLHTGYYAGRNPMPLSRLRQQRQRSVRLLKDFPDTKFVLMHIGYPYQDEFIALAKHYRNAYVDMCWAWIINPAASVRFLKEFLRRGAGEQALHLRRRLHRGRERLSATACSPGAALPRRSASLSRKAGSRRQRFLRSSSG